MGFRKERFYTGGVYHVYNKSIEGFEIFRYSEEYVRMREVIRFYRDSVARHSYSISLKRVLGADDPVLHGSERVRVIAYCLMPTHIHLLVIQTAENGVEDYMRLIQGSYASYLNKKSKRKGPLWVGRFGARHIGTDEDLWHMTRYIHLNPTSAGLVAYADDWEFSSHHEYCGANGKNPICDFKKLVPMTPAQYRKFVEDRADYQRSLQIIKSHLMD
ncbi:MAG: Transposase IS200 like protein [Candidatus Omnitrophica bacterium ADurb.Bin277]|jgi:putative transposase|nr:MAG: Transposase IS200 like protein [Candidatus Omnitrophica bacterium ADurb.Bin277]